MAPAHFSYSIAEPALRLRSFGAPSRKLEGGGIGKGFGPVIFLLQLLPPLELTAPKFSCSDMSSHAQTAPKLSQLCPLVSPDLVLGCWASDMRCAGHQSRMGVK